MCKTKTMQASFTSNASAFFRAVMSDVISEVLRNANALTLLPLEARVDAVMSALGMPEARQTYNSSAPLLPANVTALASLGSKAPPKVPSAGKPKPEGLSLNDYLARRSRGDIICAYMSNRGTMKDLVCGKPATVHVAELPTEPYKWRCTTCAKKGGILEKSITSMGLGARVASASVPSIPSVPSVATLALGSASLANQTSFNTFHTIPIPSLPKIAEPSGPVHVPVCQTSQPGLFTITKPGLTRLLLSEHEDSLVFEGKLREEPIIQDNVSEIPEDWKSQLVDPSPDDLDAIDELQIARN